MKDNIRTKSILLRLSSKEKDEFDNLRDRLVSECNIGIKRQSEIIYEAFKQYAETLLTANTHHTHTFPQGSEMAQRKARFSEVLLSIKERGFMNYIAAYNDLCWSDSYNDMKMRTKSKHFQLLMMNPDIAIFPLSKYFNTHSKQFLLMHKQSGWYLQLRELCFPLKELALKITDDNYSEQRFKADLYDRVMRKAKYKINLDKAEKLMVNTFLHELDLLPEKPMYDPNDLIIQEVIQLRKKGMWKKSLEVLEYEKQQLAQRVSTTQASKEAEEILGGLI